MKERYSAIAPHDTLVCQFHQLMQEKGEAIRDFAGCIKKVFRKLHTKNPECYLGESLLKDRLFYGMHQLLKGSLRYLYDQEHTKYNRLLRAANAAKVKSHKNLVVRTKAVNKKTSQKTTPSDVDFSDPKLQNVAKELDQLLTIFKANQIKGGWKSQLLPATPTKTKGRDKSAAGPFRGDRRPLQCWCCGGWGHTTRECLTPGNVRWRELSRAADPPRPVQEQPPNNS